MQQETKKSTFHHFQSFKAKRGQPFTDWTVFGYMGAILSPWQWWRRGASPPALPYQVLEAWWENVLLWRKFFSLFPWWSVLWKCIEKQWCKIQRWKSFPVTLTSGSQWGMHCCWKQSKTKSKKKSEKNEWQVQTTASFKTIRQTKHVLTNKQTYTHAPGDHFDNNSKENGERKF